MPNMLHNKDEDSHGRWFICISLALSTAKVNKSDVRKCAMLHQGTRSHLIRCVIMQAILPSAGAIFKLPLLFLDGFGIIVVYDLIEVRD